jgi:hypothetical protein
MNSDDVRPDPNDAQTPADSDVPEDRRDWQEPKLTFIEPALTPHGPLTSVTGQFFGAFSPPES